MDAKKLVAVITLTITISISNPHAVKAGGRPPSKSVAARLRGVVKFEGTGRKARLISMSAERNCARKHPSPVFAQEVVTDSKGDLENVVVYVAEGLGDRTFDVPAQPVVVEQRACMYQPHVLAVRANQPLDVVNDDPTAHNIHPPPANNPERRKAEPPGPSGDRTLGR